MRPVGPSAREVRLQIGKCPAAQAGTTDEVPWEAFGLSKQPIIGGAALPRLERNSPCRDHCASLPGRVCHCGPRPRDAVMCFGALLCGICWSLLYNTQKYDENMLCLCRSGRPLDLRHFYAAVKVWLITCLATKLQPYCQNATILRSY